jgi:succinate dehydrogenase / fumarate reductase membrane anchor subunit
MKNAETFWTWGIKIAAGLLIVIILGVHFVINHAVAPGGLLSYADVVRYYQSPLIVAMEIIFLVFVVTHALLGLRSIIIDLNPSEGVLRATSWVFAALGLVAVGYGVWLALAIAGRG